MTTPRLGLIELIQNQSQPHVPVNSALRRLDILVQSTVLDKDLTAPPGSFVDGDAYIIADGATGDWSGKDGNIAYRHGGWQFIVPFYGLRVFVEDEDSFYKYVAASPSGWTLDDSGSGATSLTVSDEDSPGSDVSSVTSLEFSGALVTQVSPGHARVELPAPQTLTVDDEDSPSAEVTGVTKLIFAGNIEVAEDSAGTARIKGVERIEYQIALSDMTTDLTTGATKAYMRAPRAFTLTAVRASLATASSGAAPQVDINVNGSTILSTKLTIDASEKTSVTAATPAVISNGNIADDDEITLDIDTAGTGAKGLIVTLIGHA